MNLCQKKIPWYISNLIDNLNAHIITIEIQISRCFGVYNIYTYIFTYTYTHIHRPGHRKLCDTSSAGDIAIIVAHL